MILGNHKLFALFLHPALLALALCVVSIACSRAAESPAWDRPSLGVLDINIWSGLDYKGNVTMGEYESPETREVRYQALLKQVRALDPDVIGVHEANKLPAYIDRLARDLDCDAIWHVGVGGVRAGAVGLPWNLREGDALLAKKGLRLECVKRLQLSGGPVGNFFTFHFEDATQVIAARITVKGSPVYVFSTHWHASPLDAPDVRAKLAELRASMKSPDEEYKSAIAEIDAGAAWRMDEAVKTLALADELATGTTALIIGDFNSIAELPELKLLEKGGFVNTFGALNPGKPGFTWDPVRNENQKKHYAARPKNPSLMDEFSFWEDHAQRRIDHILLRGGVKPVLVPRESRVVLDEIVDGVHTSDHFGIYTKFDVK
ncbi:MAG: hypothetical protein EPN93_16745 [Spirochaetes bacterium]|nr:MAG: hypothetical protein EPN93_16745 [Spirochaetota bacterium]